eukprot:TRINITY_DN44236_c0_g1_i1.p1 TRINITY_DN44236_c0_g1~~TRINITY_DN44236_c0_g1_i1.p1  ORF type:complete len:1207 (+),score=189.47 TRINITY_DN44236_c0_g1_i1:462-3623(+)
MATLVEAATLSAELGAIANAASPEIAVIESQLPGGETEKQCAGGEEIGGTVVDGAAGAIAIDSQDAKSADSPGPNAASAVAHGEVSGDGVIDGDNGGDHHDNSVAASGEDGGDATAADDIGEGVDASSASKATDSPGSVGTCGERHPRRVSDEKLMIWKARTLAARKKVRAAAIVIHIVEWLPRLVKETRKARCSLKLQRTVFIALRLRRLLKAARLRLYGAQAPRQKTNSASRTLILEEASPTDTDKHQYHFAFLDYYNKHYMEAASDSPAARHRQDVSLADSSVVAPHGTAGEVPADVAPVADQGKETPCDVEGVHIEIAVEDLRLPSPLRTPHVRTRRIGTGEKSPQRRGSWVDPALDATSTRKDWQRDAAEIKQLLCSIRPFEEPNVLVGICRRLVELLEQSGSNEVNNLQLVTHHGAVPIVEMLQVADPVLLRTVLKLVNQIVEGNQSFQEIFAMVGLIPAVIKFAKPHYARPLRYEAACFVSRICHTSARSLQMLIACGGLEALVDLVSHDYYQNRDLVWPALDALTKVFDSATESGHRRDLCRILAKRGLCGHLCLLIDTLASDIHERALHYLEVVINLLLFSAREGDAVVKMYMATGQVLEGLVAALEFLPNDLQVPVCKIFMSLAQEPSVLNMLENAGLVAVLVHVLSCHCEPSSKPEASEVAAKATNETADRDACSQCVKALFFLCRLSRPRQEQAALAGVVPLLQELVTQGHPLKVNAFELLCDMTCASLATRRILWAQGGVVFLVRSLASQELQTFALEALVGWMGVHEHSSDWGNRVESVLLQDDLFLRQLLTLLRSPEVDTFIKIINALVKLARVSTNINVAIGSNDEFFLELVRRLKIANQFRDSLPPSKDNLLADIINAESLQDNAPAAGSVASGEICPQSLPAMTGKPGDRAATLMPSKPKKRPTVFRLASEPAVLASDDVRARTHLLRLLLLLCQAQGHEQLACLCQRFRLQALVRHVQQEERGRGRVILCEMASQLLDLFGEASVAAAEPVGAGAASVIGTLPKTPEAKNQKGKCMPKSGRARANSGPRGRLGT